MELQAQAVVDAVLRSAGCSYSFQYSIKQIAHPGSETASRHCPAGFQAQQFLGGDVHPPSCHRDPSMITASFNAAVDSCARRSPLAGDRGQHDRGADEFGGCCRTLPYRP
jgi:hypothetical protein